MRHSVIITVLLSVSGTGCLGNLNLPFLSGNATGSAPSQTPSPSESVGAVTLHRLNKAEYNNTVRDLLNTLQTPGDNLPEEATAFGFDNIAAALTVSDSSVRIYQQAAESLAAEAMDPNGSELARLVPCDPNIIGVSACIEDVAAQFAYYAWRRPISQQDLNDIVQAASANANDFTSVATNALTYILLAPDFLFRVELDSDPNSAVTHPLNNYELASRLSYFLWSSMPDDELFAAADSNTLQDANVLLAQAHRLLADPRAGAFVQNFAGQWLELRELATATPSPAVYPDWDETLRASMLSESQHFFSDFLTSNIPIANLLTANYTYIDNRLARHYGLPMPGSSTLRKTSWPSGSLRGGFLTQGAWLTTQAHADRSGPVARGKFVLGQLLCSPPSAPPPNVPPLSSAAGFQGTQRQHLEQHVANATCAVCHNSIDPIGFALESFDGIGAQRSTDNGFPVDTSGAFGGTPFVGAADLAKLLAADARFAPCVVSTLFTYALGRGPTTEDAAALSTMTQQFAQRGNALPALIDIIVASDTFRMRRGANP